jgi:hypothetical protein
MFAEGGTVVEQPFFVDRGEDGRLVLKYGTLEDADVPTTENGNPVPEPFEFFDGEVTLSAPDPWMESGFIWGLDIQGPGNFNASLGFARFPRSVGTGCSEGPPPADAEALALTLRSDPDIATTVPEGVNVGGIDALRMDVSAAPQASVCKNWGAPLLLAANRDHRGVGLEQGTRSRLYLLDLPEGSSTQILAITVTAPEDRFKSVVQAAAPIVDSIEFHAP